MIRIANLCRCSFLHKNAAAPPSRLVSTWLPINDALCSFTSSQTKLRESVFEFAQREIAPFAKEIDRDDNVPFFKELWIKLGRLGLHGITVPSAYGGSDCTFVEHCIAMEELSRASASVALSYGAHSNLCINQISNHGNAEQKSRLLPKLCSGDWVGALAMSEVDAGSDVLAMKTTAQNRGDHYLLNGSKFWITNGHVADLIIVYAKTNADPASKPRNVTAFLVEKTSPGFSVGPKLDKLGMRGSPTCELVFNDCVVPAQNVLGQLDHAVYLMMRGLDVERLILAAGPVGIMQACCDVAFEYAHIRKAFGQAIGKQQLIQSKMADMYVALSTSRCYLYSIAKACSTGEWKADYSKDCAGVILYCAERATSVALEAIQCLGGNGYVNDYPCGRLLRDAKLYEIGAGTSEIRRLVIGRALNKHYLT